MGSVRELRGREPVSLHECWPYFCANIHARSCTNEHYNAWYLQHAGCVALGGRRLIGMMEAFQSERSKLQHVMSTTYSAICFHSPLAPSRTALYACSVPVDHDLAISLCHRYPVSNSLLVERETARSLPQRCRGPLVVRRRRKPGTPVAVEPEQCCADVQDLIFVCVEQRPPRHR